MAAHMKDARNRHRTHCFTNTPAVCGIPSAKPVISS